MHNHHCHCNHTEVKFCKHCNTVYCVECKMEWKPPCTLTHYWQQSYQPNWPYVSASGSSLTVKGSLTNTPTSVGYIQTNTSCEHGAANG